jgi:hypothetical protein
MDDLLAQLKAEFEPQQPNAQKPQALKSQQPPQKSSDSASMEQMLAELRTELESGRNRPGNPPKQQATPINNQADVTNAKNNRQRLNAIIDADYQQQAEKREAKLAEIKRQEEAKIAEQKRRQQELIEAQRREELRERRRKQALREQAQQWLKNLHLNSEEGRWFEEFSYSYESKLEAAIDYLEAMRETGL